MRPAPNKKSPSSIRGLRDVVGRPLAKLPTGFGHITQYITRNDALMMYSPFLAEKTGKTPKKHSESV